MNILHSSATDQWGTPDHVIEAVYEVMGTIDLDPASSATWNNQVLATQYYTAADDGLSQPWAGAVYVNPPGGKLGNKSLAGLFWQKLMQERDSIDHAIFMAFSIEALAHTQKPFSKSIMDFTFCVPRKRIAFVSPGEGNKRSPSHSNVIVYVPGRRNYEERFRQVFRTFGACK